jgi:hypothetical protein
MGLQQFSGSTDERRRTGIAKVRPEFYSFVDFRDRSLVYPIDFVWVYF